MPFTLRLAAVAFVACEPGPLVLAWGGRVVPGLSAPLLVDMASLAGLPSLLPVDFGRTMDRWLWTVDMPNVTNWDLTRSGVALDRQRLFVTLRELFFPF